MQTEHVTHGLVQEYYVQHNAWLYQWLYKKIGSSFDAADLTQDTFARLLGKNELVSIREPRAYLTRIAHDLMVSLFRRRDLERNYLASLTALDEAMHPSPEVRAMVMEAIFAVDQMLNGLKPKVRTAFLLQQLDGLKYAEIARELDISVKTVGVYIASAVLHCASFEAGDRG